MLDTAFPFHLVLDHELTIRQAGSSLSVLCPELAVGCALTSTFELIAPRVPATFAAFQSRPRSLFLLRTYGGVQLRGQMLSGGAEAMLVFVGSPWVTDASALRAAGLTLNDFAASDAVIDYMLLFQQQARALTQAHELAEALASSDRRTRRILETANDAFIELDADGVVSGWNPRAEQMFGWSPAEALGRTFQELVIPPELQQHHRPQLAEVLASAESGDPARAGDRVARRKDGSSIPIEVAIWETRHEGRQSVHISARDITERQDAQRRTQEQATRFEHQALHDPLTGLANRALLRDRLERALAAPDTTLSVLLLDLDDFKTVNDISGHAAGDELLVEVARRLSACVREGDTVARLGGDEFAVVVREGDPGQLAARVLQRLAVPISIAGRQVVPAASIGIAKGAGATDLTQLLMYADVAMYAAKSRGKGRAEHFSAGMADTIRRRADLQEGLRRAVEAEEIVVHYQPILDVRTGSVTRFEALVRWQRPTGLVPPDRFLALAEESGLILDIGQEVLRQTCLQMRAWLVQDPSRSVAVNVSARQLAEPDLADRFLRTLHDLGVRPAQLVLEVTETLFLDTTPELIDRLRQLRDRGVRISIDDFGTGYSSLGRLHALPIDSIKIDKSFVDLIQTGSEDLPIITSMILMAHALGLDVTAEGVETTQQAERLLALGCDYLQGYLLAEPAPADTALTTSATQTQDNWPAIVSARVKTPRVLLIEDDPVSRALTRIALTDRGFEIEDARSGAEGLVLAAKFLPDCVVVDLGLPDMDGLDVVHELRNRPELTGSAIVVLTGAAHRDIKARAFAAGADDYLVKPIIGAHLSARLHGAIQALSHHPELEPDRQIE